MKNIGKVLKIIRHANNMSLGVASSASGVSAIYISELENGKKNNVSEEYLKKLAAGYGLHSYQLVELDEYYTQLCVGEDRKFKLVLMKTLEAMEANYQQSLMPKLSRRQAHGLILLAETVERANEIIEQHLGQVDFNEKIAFIKGMFDVAEIVDRQENDTDELIYYLLLTGIVNNS